MINRKMVINTQRLSIWVVILSIISLFFISFFPLISTTEQDFVKKDLYYNYEMMKNTDNYEIFKITEKLDLIYLSIWLILIFSLISFLGSIIYASGKLSILGLIFVLCGCFVIILSILAIYNQIQIVNSLKQSNILSPASIFSSFYFIYITLIPNIIILILSIFYVWTATLAFFKFIKDYLKSDRENKKIKKQKKEKKSYFENMPDKKTVENKSKIKEKSIEMEAWLKGQVENEESKDEKKKEINEKEEEIEPINETIKDEEKNEEINDTKKIEKKSPFANNIKEKEQTKKDIEVKKEDTKSFEKALSSAIQKRKPGVEEKQDIKEKITKEKNEKENVEDKKINVRCPKCKTVFSITKEGTFTKIKCPSCGKEGVIR